MASWLLYLTQSVRARKIRIKEVQSKPMLDRNVWCGLVVVFGVRDYMSLILSGSEF